MAYMAPRASKGGFMMGNCGVVALLLCASLFTQVELVKGDTFNPGILQQLAVDFCVKYAASKDVNCDCAFTGIDPPPGTNPISTCAYSSKLGPGLEVPSRLQGSTQQQPIPTRNAVVKQTCDARQSKSAVTKCDVTGASLTLYSPLIISNSLGFDTDLIISVPFKGSFTQLIKAPLKWGQEVQDGEAFTDQSCKPPASGQSAGTCSVYTETYNSVDLDGVQFTYNVPIQGGVQMQFSKSGIPVSRQAYFTIAQILEWGQSSVGNLPNAVEHFASAPKYGNDPITFLGTGTFGRGTILVSRGCAVTKC